MLCVVTLLRERGRRLKRSELPTPVLGELEVALDDGRTSFKRVLMVANLTVERSPGIRQHAVLPLFDARLAKIEGDAITLIGIELSSEARGPTLEYVQVWQCVPVASTDA